MANLSNINNKFLVTTGGNVLIGQTAAVGTSKLQVTGNSTFAGDVIIDDGVGRLTLDSISGANRIMSTTTGFAAYETLQFRAENYEFQIAATTKLSIDGSGNAAFAGNLTADNFILGGSDDNVYYGVYRAGTETREVRLVSYAPTPNSKVQLGFQNADYSFDPVLTTTASGNVGINETSPDAKLDVELTDTNTYSSTALNTATIIAQTFNTSNVNNQASIISLRTTGWAGSTTGVVNIGAVQASGNASSADFVVQTRNAGTYGERMRIDSSGTVGINNSSLKTVNTFQSNLFVGETLYIANYNVSSNQQAVFGCNTYYNSGYKAVTGATSAAAINIGVGAINFITAPTVAADNTQTFTTRMHIQNGGNVGIGTISPQRRLTVGDGSGSELISIYAGNTSSSAIHFTDTNTTTDYQGFVTYNHNLDALRFGTAEEERMRITSAGDILCTSDGGSDAFRVFNPGTGSGDIYLRVEKAYTSAAVGRAAGIILGSNAGNLGSTWTMEATSQLAYFSGADLAFTHNSGGTASRRVTFKDGGDVGINIALPQSKLHVNGGAIISNTRFGDFAVASLNTTGVVVARVDSSTNGQSAIVEFVASGNNGRYYNVVYSCYNGGGAWFYSKNVVGSAGNIEVAETNGGGSSELTFKFRATSGTASYTPRVMMKGMPYNLVTF